MNLGSILAHVGHFWVIFDPFVGHLWTQVLNKTPKDPKTVNKLNPVYTHVGTIFGILGVIFSSIFVDTFWNP